MILAYTRMVTLKVVVGFRISINGRANRIAHKLVSYKKKRIQGFKDNSRILV